MAGTPWMKFYPTDWQADTLLRSCSMTARGLWIELLCLMHKSEQPGVLMVAGKAPTDQQLGVLVGATKTVVKNALKELENARVFDKNSEGFLVSRRMIRDHRRSLLGKENGPKGGNPNLAKGVNPQNAPRIQKPEARDQIEVGLFESSADAPPKEPSGTQLRNGTLRQAMEQLWELAPARSRGRTTKQKVADAIAAQTKRGVPFNRILAGAAAYYGDDEQQRENGRYAKGLELFVKGGFFETHAAQADVAFDPAAWPPERWEGALRRYRAEGEWPTTAGPPPGRPGCNAPAHLLKGLVQ